MWQYIGPARVVGLPEADISAEAFAKLTPELQAIVKRSGVYVLVDPEAEGEAEGEAKPKSSTSRKAKAAKAKAEGEGETETEE